MQKFLLIQELVEISFQINQQINFKIRKKTTGKTFQAFLEDGTKINVEEESIDTTMITGDYNDLISFQPFPLKKYDAVLGMEWFIKNNPIINWKERSYFKEV